MRVKDRIEAMIKNQIIKRGITDPKIINAFKKVPRHLFVPDYIEEYIAYMDGPLNIGYGQTISQPFTVAFMMQALNLDENDLVLEIGTGSGYQTALLAEIVKKVYTIERIEELYRQAKNRLEAMGYKNIEFYVGDGTTGWYDKSLLFDKIIVTAGAPIVPESLIKQLKTGGKMIIPVGGKYSQSMRLIIKKPMDYEEYELGEFTFVPLIGKEGWQ